MVQTTSADLVSTDMDVTWKKFLRQKVNSFIKWDLVRFFHDNPYTADTAENIAQFVGRDAKSIRRELNDLVQSGVLDKENVSDLAIYRLSQNDDVRQLISSFMTACHDREFRVKAINQVISGMGFGARHDR